MTTLDKLIDDRIVSTFECVAVRREGKYWGVYHMKMSRQGEREHKLNSFYVKRRAVELARDFADIMDIADVTIEEG